MSNTPPATPGDEDAILSAENEGMDEAAGHPPLGRINPLAETVAALEKERDQLKDNLLRALAETDNVRKRANRQIEDARLYAVEKFARDLLGVVDNLARAVESVPPTSRGIMTDAVKTALEGVDLTQKELVAALSRHGVTAIDSSPGAAFDPNMHQAVTQVPSEHPAGSVAELYQSGWRIGDRTLRAALVAVSGGKGAVQ
ncbi:MAG: nucleotide exchange factor GrpE [Hyphomonadaceae bacterium]